MLCLGVQKPSSRSPRKSNTPPGQFFSSLGQWDNADLKMHVQGKQREMSLSKKCEMWVQYLTTKIEETKARQTKEAM